MMSAVKPTPLLWDVVVPAPAPAPVFKALAAAGLIAPFLSHGAIITVNTTAETGSAGQCSLRDAASAVRFPGASINGCAVADAPPVGNEIRFAANVVGTITYSAPHTPFNYAGVEILPQSNLTIAGPGASTLGISCNANAVSVGSMLVFTNTASNISISGLGFNNCLAQGTLFAGAAGLSVFDLGSNAVNQITLSDLVISGNSGGVGGLNVSSTGVTTLRRLSITGNTGQFVGGFAVQGLNDGADVDIQSSTIANNLGSQLSAGAVFTDGDISMNNVTVSGNVGGQNALLLAGGDVGVRHSTIVRNTTDPLANTTSYTALQFGFGGFGRSFLAKSARADQKALTVASGLNNSIVCGNSQYDIGTSSNVVANYNLIGSVSPDYGAVPFGTGNVTNCTAAQLNGWLGPLANNGGPTQTHALLNVPGNPAINGGDPAYTGSPNDQTGVTPRISGGRTDMGAVEFAAAPAPQAVGAPVPVNGALGLGALSLALAALGARRRKKTDDTKI
jgi:hypothetical protein